MRSPLLWAGNAPSLLLTTLSLGVSRRLSSRAMMEAAAADSADRQRLQRHMDSVDVSAPPRIELTYGTATCVGDSLAVLDSSFNPPTRAHLHLLTLAAEELGLSHSLLLLAKQNADKPVIGATLIQRLEMMECIAAAQPQASMLCGVTAHPLFVDKAAALRALCTPETRIAVLVGFDTWIRIIDPKYYAEGGLEVALRQIFDAVEVVVASRDPASVSNVAPLSAAEQEAVVRALPASLPPERLHFLHNSPEMAPLSSSAIRKALAGTNDNESAAGSTDGAGSALAGAGDVLPAHVREMLPDSLHAYVEAQHLYREV